MPSVSLCTDRQPQTGHNDRADGDADLCGITGDREALELEGEQDPPACGLFDLGDCELECPAPGLIEAC